MLLTKLQHCSVHGDIIVCQVYVSLFVFKVTLPIKLFPCCKANRHGAYITLQVFTRIYLVAMEPCALLRLHKHYTTISTIPACIVTLCLLLSSTGVHIWEQDQSTLACVFKQCMCIFWITIIMCNVYLIVVTQTRVACLIYAAGAQELRVYISGRPQVPVLQLLHLYVTLKLLCNTNNCYVTLTLADSTA